MTPAERFLVRKGATYSRPQDRASVWRSQSRFHGTGKPAPGLGARGRFPLPFLCLEVKGRLQG